MKEIENKLYQQGYQNVAGLDEVGRGCWAGPLVVAICVFDPKYVNNEIRDSKKLSDKKRNDLFNVIKEDALICDWIIFDAPFVDLHNPKQTSIIGMEKLINKHLKEIDYCLIDAEKVDVSVNTSSIIKGDEKSQVIAAASIVAKVIRDQIMIEYSKKYPQYHFELNKGYGTKAHQQALKKFGPIKNIHRFSYKPIKSWKTKN